MSDTITSIERHLRTVRAIRASVEPDDEMTPRQWRQHAEQVERDYRTLVAERDYWRRLYEFAAEAQRQAARRAAWWRNVTLYASGLALCVLGALTQRIALVVAGLGLVTLTNWINVREQEMGE